MAGLLAGGLGDPAGGLATARRAIAACRASDLLILLPHLLGIEAELIALDGDPRGGLARLAETGSLMREMGARWEESRLLRRRGDMLAALGEAAGAEAAWQGAVQAAAAQEAWLQALQAALPLAEALARRGAGAEARAVLGAALDAFGDAEEAPIREARRLLASLDAG
jgi:hypothetical protein